MTRSIRCTRRSRDRAAWSPRLGLSALALATPAAFAQCDPHWTPTPGIAGPTGANVSAIVLWDPDGPGPRPPLVVVGGTFTSIAGVAADNIAAWDGTTWAPLGAGLVGSYVDSMAVLPDGRLVVSGALSQAGSIPVNNIAAWDGTAWSTLGSGLNNETFALAVGLRGELYAGGLFTTAGGVAANRVAVWEHGVWSSLGTGSANGVTNVVYALTVHGGGDLYVGGGFTAAGGVANRRYVARWNNESNTWATVGPGMNSAVLTLCTMPNGDIIASGIFTFAGTGPASRIARWNGLAWSPLGAGTNAQSLGLLPLPNGDLIAGGHFVVAGGQPASKIARWDGSAWHALGLGMDNYVMGLLLAPNADGGTDLYAGGGFTTVEGVASPGLARWEAPVAPAPSMAPATQTACPNADAVFTATFTGTPTLTYGWLHDGAPLSDTPGHVSGAKSPTLTVLGVGTPDAGAYVCVATNNCGSAASFPATLTVAGPGDPMCCPCAADFNASGGTPDASDIDAFFSAWLAGDPTADADCSGGTPDSGDIDVFFGQWLAGGC